jgi:Leucine-rich repeat (LRR) protein
MAIVLELDDNTKYELNSYQYISKDIYTKIISLKCNNCNLNNIDFIANFINLKKLNASFNNIKTIPIITSLEELDIYNNELEELPILPNLKKLYAFNNKLKSVPKLLNLEIIDVSHNNISNISLGENIIYIYVGHNKITKIDLLSKNVLELECNNNLLKTINFIHGLDKLIKINYNDNMITYEPPYVKRFVPNNNNQQLITNSMHQIDINATKYILKLLDKKPNMNYQRIDCDILNNNILNPASKKILLLCLKANNIIEPTLKITMLELFLNLWTEIKKNNNFNKINEVLINNKCKCISCMFNYMAIL